MAFATSLNSPPKYFRCQNYRNQLNFWHISYMSVCSKAFKRFLWILLDDIPGCLWNFQNVSISFGFLMMFSYDFRFKRRGNLKGSWKHRKSEGIHTQWVLSFMWNGVLEIFILQAEISEEAWNWDLSCSLEGHAAVVCWRVHAVFISSLLLQQLSHPEASVNRPFYICVPSYLAFEWKWGWSWHCFDRNLTAFHMQIPTN